MTDTNDLRRRLGELQRSMQQQTVIMQENAALTKQQLLRDGLRIAALEADNAKARAIIEVLVYSQGILHDMGDQICCNYCGVTLRYTLDDHKRDNDHADDCPVAHGRALLAKERAR